MRGFDGYTVYFLGYTSSGKCGSLMSLSKARQQTRDKLRLVYPDENRMQDTPRARGFWVQAGLGLRECLGVCLDWMVRHLVHVLFSITNRAFDALDLEPEYEK